MISVKGMTWGSTEFVAVAKAAETEGEANYQVGQIAEIEAEMTDECRERARGKVADLFELIEECDCDCY